jgi:hypothetical protein
LSNPQWNRNSQNASLCTGEPMIQILHYLFY